MRRAPKNQVGFTMAEAIISVVILGLMGGLVAGTFSSALDARERAEEITNHYGQVRKAMLRMSREIQMAFISEHRDCDDPRTDTVFKTESSSNGQRLDFTSFSHYKIFADANESDQNELSYWVDRRPDPEDDEDPNELVLLRREASRIDEEPDEGGVVQVMATGIKSLEFEFYNEREDRWEDEWDTKGLDFKKRMPMFVRIMMTTKGLGQNAKDEKFETKTRIFLRRPIAILGTGFAPCTD